MQLPRRLQLLLRIREALLDNLLGSLDELLRGRGLLDGVLDLDDRTLVAGHGALDHDNTKLVVDHQDGQVLDRVLLGAHATGHLLAGQDTRTGALRTTDGTDGSVVLGVTVRRLLTGEAVLLHATGETHTARDTPDINPLADVEPIGKELHAHGQQAVLVAHLELRQRLLGRDALGLVVAELRGADVVRSALAQPDLHGPVAVLLARLVGDDLDPVELQHRARDATAGAAHEDRHALLDGEHAGAQGCGLLAALEGGGGTGGGRGETLGDLVESCGPAALRERAPAVFDAALCDLRKEGGKEGRWRRGAGCGCGTAGEEERAGGGGVGG